MALQTFSQPVWQTLDNVGASNNVTLASSTPIAHRGNQSVASETAVQFCNEFGFTLSDFVTGSNENPTVSWDPNQNRWENDGLEPVYLQITCDDGLNQSIGEVNIANIGDIMFLLGIVIALLTVQVSLLTFGRN